jgi:hypothetical protein
MSTQEREADRALIERLHGAICDDELCIECGLMREAASALERLMAERDEARKRASDVHRRAQLAEAAEQKASAALVEMSARYDAADIVAVKLRGELGNERERRERAEERAERLEQWARKALLWLPYHEPTHPDYPGEEADIGREGHALLSTTPPQEETNDAR